MAFRLRTSECSAQGLARLAVEQVDMALSALRPPVDDRDIHRARQSFKRLRAIIRLLKPMLGGRDRSLHVALREAGRALAPWRDALVISTTLHQLDAHCAQVAAPCPVPPEALAMLADRLQSLRSQFSDWAQESWERKQLRRSFRRAEKRARRAMKRALSQGTAEDWHTWRKRVKDLFYQSQCLYPHRPQTRQLARLAKVLGKEHDLSMLESAWDDGQEVTVEWRDKLNVRREKLRRCARQWDRDTKWR